MSRRKKLKWTPEVIAATRKAALAVAEMWDQLREFEIANDVEFDGTVKMLGDDLAPACNWPPKDSDLPDACIIEALNQLDREEVVN